MKNKDIVKVVLGLTLTVIANVWYFKRISDRNESNHKLITALGNAALHQCTSPLTSFLGIQFGSTYNGHSTQEIKDGFITKRMFNPSNNFLNFNEYCVWCTQDNTIIGVEMCSSSKSEHSSREVFEATVKVIEQKYGKELADCKSDIQNTILSKALYFSNTGIIGVTLFKMDNLYFVSVQATTTDIYNRAKNRSVNSAVNVL